MILLYPYRAVIAYKKILTADFYQTDKNLEGNLWFSLRIGVLENEVDRKWCEIMICFFIINNVEKNC